MGIAAAQGLTHLVVPRSRPMSALSKVLRRVTQQLQHAATPTPPRPVTTPVDGFDVARPGLTSTPAPAVDVNALRAARAASVAASRTAVPDADAYQRFLEGADQVYRDELKRPLLGASVDVAGVAAYGARFLNEGWSLDQVRASVRQSPEWREKHPGEASGPDAASSSRRRTVTSEAQLADATTQLSALYREELKR
jgi:hypothetical protein